MSWCRGIPWFRPWSYVIAKMMCQSSPNLSVTSSRKFENLQMIITEIEKILRTMTLIYIFTTTIRNIVLISVILRALFKTLSRFLYITWHCITLIGKMWRFSHTKVDEPIIWNVRGSTCEGFQRVETRTYDMFSSFVKLYLSILQSVW